MVFYNFTSFLEMIREAAAVICSTVIKKLITSPSKLFFLNL